MTKNPDLFTEVKATVKIPSGLHARPVVELSTIAQDYKSEIYITYKEKQVSLANLFDLLMLMIDPGEDIMISAHGPDHEKICHLLKDYVENEQLTF